MLPTTIHASPALESFTPIAEHQSQTPTTFYGSKPILHYHDAGARALVSQDHVSKFPVFARQPAQPETGTTGDDGTANKIMAEVVDVFVSSENLTIFNPVSCTGLSIPYPAISLHAIQRLDDPTDLTQQIQGLYMQLELSDPLGVAEDDEPDIVELTLVPAPTSPAGTSATHGVQALFEAVSNCSNLHPDPTFEDEEMEDGDANSRIVFEGNVGYEGISGLPGVQMGASDGGLPPPFPGSGGWITAENVSEYFDEDGNWIGQGDGEGLGEGAGRVRTRSEIDGEGVNGHGGDDIDDNKRPRTD